MPFLDASPVVSIFLHCLCNYRHNSDVLALLRKCKQTSFLTFPCYSLTFASIKITQPRPSGNVKLSYLTCKYCYSFLQISLAYSKMVHFESLKRLWFLFEMPFPCTGNCTLRSTALEFLCKFSHEFPRYCDHTGS